MAAPSESALDHWRSLLAATAPGVAIATVLQGLLGASAGVLIANGSFVTDRGWQSAVVGAMWWLAWAFSLAAAMIVMRGTLVDAPVRASFALRAALRRWGPMVFVILIISLLIIVLFFLAGLLAGVLGPLAFIAFAILAVSLTTAAIGALPLAVLASETPFIAMSRSWELASGKRWYMVGISLCVAVPGVAITWAQPRVGSWASGPVTGLVLSLGLALLSVIVIGFQASILARWFVNLDGVERSLGSRPRPDRWRLGFGLLVTAALAVTITTVLNPWGVPVLASSPAADDDRGLLVARGGTVLPDGRRLTVAHDQSNAVVHFEICGTEPYCDTKLLTTFERPGLMWEYRAALAVGEGLAVVALVQQPGDQADQVKLVVWHCPTVACARTTRTVVGSVFSGSRLMFAVDVDAQGHPLIAWGTTAQDNAMVVRCADAACTRSTQDWVQYATEVDGRWPMSTGLGFDALHRLVAVLADYPERPQREGLQIRIAEPPDPAPLVATVTCRSADCEDRIVQRWFVPETAYHDVVRPVAQPDGSLVLVAGVGNGFWSSAHLIRCESHCG